MKRREENNIDKANLPDRLNRESVRGNTSKKNKKFGNQGARSKREGRVGGAMGAGLGGTAGSNGE